MKKPFDTTKKSVLVSGVTLNDDEKKRVLKMLRAAQNNKRVEVSKHNLDTRNYVETMLFQKGLRRLNRHPSDGSPICLQPKNRHLKELLQPLVAVAALDQNDPNYEDDDEEVASAFLAA